MRPRGERAALALVVLAGLLAGCHGGGGPTGTPALSSTPVLSVPSSTHRASPSHASSARASSSTRVPAPAPRHIVVVVMENKSYDDIIGNPNAPYINALARHGALFTQSYADYHPSEPNYLVLFSGSNQGITSDACGLSFSTPNLYTSLAAKHLTFTGYSEGLPSAGFTGCSAGSYARKHVPWSDFSNVPAAVSQPLTAFPSNLAKLPSVAFVVPTLEDDMHDGSIATGDAWLQAHIGGYLDWARVHNSQLVLTWDEDDQSESNRIVTIVAGAGVRNGQYAEHIDHYRVLRTIEDAFGVTPVGLSNRAAPITDIWAE